MKYFPELRVKIKTARAEAHIIRHEALRARNPLRASYLTEHRRQELREEARWSNLAYGFLRGRMYAELEREARTEPNWYRVKAIAWRFGRYKPEGWETYGRESDRCQELVSNWDQWEQAGKEIWAHDHSLWQDRHAEQVAYRHEQKALRRQAQQDQEKWAADREAKRIAWAREEARQGRFPFGFDPGIESAVQEPEPAAQD